MKLVRRKPREATAVYRRSPEVTIRWATSADEQRLGTLAELDEAGVPAPPLLLGLVGDELWVAASLPSGAIIAHPFRRSADVVALVIERGRQLTVPHPRPARSRLLRVRPGPLPVRATTGGAPRPTPEASQVEL